jgi:hypothetical protein
MVKRRKHAPFHYFVYRGVIENPPRHGIKFALKLNIKTVRVPVYVAALVTSGNARKMMR